MIIKTVKELLSSTDYGSNVDVKGWVRSKRGSKEVAFLPINDGSTIKNIQVVVDLTAFSEDTMK
ncbi:MAG TPA: OB-fold nucleic acid binding domain-containing protein, partial [Bacteroidia bacterium]|nr:OB-fold nucleic acid binding domain-containing protein [Bacteroidia bacterium]